MGKKTETVRIDVEIPKEGTTYEARVTDLDVKPASEIFGAKAKDPTRPTIVVHFEGDGGISGKGNLSAPGYKAGKPVVVRNPKSNLYKFVKRYGGSPTVGQTVDVAIDEDGFYRLVLE